MAEAAKEPVSSSQQIPVMAQAVDEAAPLQQQVSAIKEAKAGPASSSQQSPFMAHASQIRKLKELIKDPQNSVLLPENLDITIPVYQLKLKELKNPPGSQCTHSEYGKSLGNTAPQKTLICVGETGTGKTTLLNALVNYIFGVELQDGFRIKLVTESHDVPQSQSQTQHVNVYTLYHQPGFTIPFTLTIIDTPGSGDTDGIEGDKIKFEEIRDFFNLEDPIVTHIDMIALVVKSPSQKLTTRQIYVFELVQNIFADDIEKNIVAAVTFCDGSRPLIIPSMREAGIPYSHVFKFNCSGIYSDPHDSFAANFWNLSMKSCKEFMTYLEKNVTPTSVSLTQEQLQLRVNIENYNVVLYNEIQDGITKLIQLENKGRKLKDHENESKRYEFYERESESEEEFEERIHDGPLTILRRGAVSAARKMGINLRYPPTHKMVKKTVMKTKIDKDKKENYENATKQVSSAENDILASYLEFQETEKEVMAEFCLIRENTERLKEIALKKRVPTSVVDYIDAMITQTVVEELEDWRDRLKYLQAYRKSAKQLMDLSEKENFDPFAELAYVKKQAEKTVEKKLSKRAEELWAAISPFMILLNTETGPS